MGSRSILKLLILLIIVVVAGVYYVVPAAKSMNLGLDLKGGVYVLVEGVDTDKHKVTEQDMTQLVAVIRQRVDKLGVAEPTIQRQGKKRIIVELPAVKDSETAIQLIGQTASLKFMDETGKVLLDGKNLKKAQAGMDQTNGAIVSLEFDSVGAEKFAAATAANVGKRIAIMLDTNVISAPVVNQAISGGKAQIEGMESAEAAQQLAILLNSGALPVDIKIMETRTIGPQLGKDSIDASVKAAILGIALVALYMLFWYRKPGFLADVALAIYVLLVAGVMAGINVTLTLPGIAALILSVGMAVDANVIIFERIKDELRHGKSIRSAVDAGFNRAFWTIFDSNITTLIAAGVLFYFGTGPIRGFAVTLSIGVIGSMVTSIVITRFLLKTVMELKWAKNSNFFGIKRAAAVETGVAK